LSTEKAVISCSISFSVLVAVMVIRKASLLRALQGDLLNYRFVASEVFAKPIKVLSTYGMEALVAMRRTRNFDQLNKQHVAKGGKNLYEEFAFIFKKAVGSGDIALIAMAAEIIRDPELNFNKLYKNTYFLTQALQRCELPRDIEAYIELQRTINYINGTNTKIPSMMNNPIDWDLVTSIAPEQKIIIKTDKGDITLQLMVNKAPGTVANFIRLVKDGFYKRSVFHRVVPNFVTQDGCPRGDGWGSPSYSIRSEFFDENFEEGYVGMASAGKDTESSQWFITHSPAPHLDGKYTIFAKVIAGMDCVHKLELGDKINDMEIE